MALTKVSRGLLSTSIDDNGNATAITIDSSENVGIGVTNPSDYYASWNNLVVGDTSGSAGMSIVTGTSNEGTIAFADGTSGDAQYKGYIQYNQGVDRLVIGVNGTEKMRIDSSGNVGIGTSSPAFPLDVNHASDNGLARFTSGDADAYITIGDVNSTSAHNKIGVITHDMYFNTNGSERMRIDSSGNLLVGTTVSPASGDPTSVRYGIGVQAGSLSSTTTCTAGVITNVLDMANAVSGVNGAGLWLISVIRGGASYATHFTGVFGVNSSSMVLYQTIQSSGMTVSVNGLNLRINVSTTDGYRVNAIPLSINT